MTGSAVTRLVAAVLGLLLMAAGGVTMASAMPLPAASLKAWAILGSGVAAIEVGLYSLVTNGIYGE